MEEITVTLKRDTLAEVVIGEALHDAMHNIVAQIVDYTQEHGDDLDGQVYLAQQLVALYDLESTLQHALNMDAKRRREEREAAEV